MGLVGSATGHTILVHHTLLTTGKCNSIPKKWVPMHTGYHEKKEVMPTAFATILLINTNINILLTFIYYIYSTLILYFTLEKFKSDTSISL